MLSISITKELSVITLTKSRLIWGLCFGVGMLVITAAVVRSHKPQHAFSGVVTYKDLNQKVTVAGNVNANRKTLISAPYNGYVSKIYVEVGDQVRAGDPIVSITQSLRANPGEIFPLRAPFAGTVVQILRTEGEYVESATAPNNMLVRIDDLTHLFAEASVPEIEVAKLKKGQEVTLKASAITDHTYKGKINRISLAAKDQKEWEKARSEFTVLVDIADADSRLKPGMTVILDVFTRKLTHVLTLPHEFVQKEGDHYFVVTVEGVKKNIEPGLQNEEILEIRSGLTEGESVKLVDLLTSPLTPAEGS